MHGDQPIGLHSETQIANQLRELSIGELSTVGQLQITQMQDNYEENLQMTRHLTLIDNVIANKALADESGDRQSSNQHEERAGESGKSAGGIMEVDATSDVESSSTSPPTRRRDQSIAKAPPSRTILLPPAPLPIATASKARGAEPANPLAITPCQYSDVRRKSAPAQPRGQY